MTKKISALLIIIFITANIVVLYGFLLNIVTYHISEEFYTKYLFYEFYILSDYEREFSGNIYLALLWISFLSNIVFSIILSLILGLIGFFFKTGKTMLSNVLKSVFLVLLITILFNILGYVLSLVFPGDRLSFYQYPFTLLDRVNFNIANWINLFGYIGLAVGTLIAIAYLIKKIKADTTKNLTQ